MTTDPTCKVSGRPLVSFALFAYNQEEFIREAVQGAFAQNYSPLQIILSDDCSSDNTFQIMTAMAAEYGGPHVVILNHNAKNFGIGGHINRIMEIASGDLIVIAAGDDISHPNRVNKIVDCHIHTGALYMFSDYFEIDESGRKKLKFFEFDSLKYHSPYDLCKRNFGVIIGCTAAWHKCIFESYGPMLPEIVNEDKVIPFRAALKGSIYHLAEPLVDYRKHALNVSHMHHSSSFHAMSKTTLCLLNVYRNNMRDCETHLQKFDPDSSNGKRCLVVIKRKIRRYEAYQDIYAGNVRAVVLALLKIAINFGNPFHACRLIARRISGSIF